MYVHHDGTMFPRLLSLLTAFPKCGVQQNPSFALKAKLASLSYMFLPSGLLSPAHSLLQPHLPSLKEAILIRSSVPLKAADHNNPHVPA